VGARVLLVDDEPDWRQLLRELLQARGHQVDVAGSLMEALDKLKEGAPYEVLVTDVTLSPRSENRDGIELLQILRQRWPSTTAIAISGRARFGDVEAFKRRYHALDYVDRRVLVQDLDAFAALVDSAAGRSRDADTDQGGTAP